MFRKLLHIITAGLILVSITGFTINMHYCHDQLIDFAVFSPAQSCCDPGYEGSCHENGDISKMNHCKDESLQVGSTDDYVGTSFTFSFENNLSIDLLLSATILYNFQAPENIPALETPWHKEPPPCQEVVLSQIQSFLI